MSTTLIISDLHLQESSPQLSALAFALLDNVACDQLYILGDLFEYWIGDDSVDRVAETVASKLAALHSRGTAIHVMHGNRDFLLGEEFVTAFGGKLLREDTVMAEIGGQQTLLMHGDTLCTDCLLYTSPSPRDATLSRMPSSA